MRETRIVLDGRGLLESPRWHRGRLYVSDWSAGQVLSVDPAEDADQDAEVVAHVDSLPLCTDWLPDGRLLVVSSREGRLLRREHDGSLTTYAELGRSGWNDIVVDGRGRAFVNGAGFDPMAGEEPRPGVVALVTADRTVTEVAGDIAFPNGMAVTADNRTLVVADSYGHCLVGFEIADGGSLSGRHTWAALGDGTPDGICLDAEGAAWYADVPHRRCVRVAPGGAVLETLDLDRGAFACVLGGPGGRTLFVAAAQWLGMDTADLVVRGSGQVLAVDVDVPGAGWP
jgi:sugar lactone lactonase YvrE